MSGFAAVYRRDGAPADGSCLSGMLDELARRGPEGEARTCDGPVALGHRMLATTPEALVEPMPFHWPETGCRITGEIRLDNREALLATFDLDPHSRTIGDGELVLRAWMKWGEACPEHLLGDFAFALWDPRKSCLFAARDHMGMRQLIYTHIEGAVFACANSARAVIRAPGVTPRLNELRVAEALIDFEDGSPTGTFFQGVSRLPRGSSLSVTPRGLFQRSYWKPEPSDPLRLGSNAEYEEALLEVLTEAVRCRLRSAGPVGSMLSGGMDSGSVVSIASRLLQDSGAGPLQTFSVVGPDPETCVETRAVHAALAMPNLSPTLLDYSQLGSLQAEIVELCRAIDEPFDFSMNLPRASYLAARNAGITVLLDGVAGDVVLSSADQLGRLILSGHLLRAWNDARKLRDFWGDGAPPVWKEYLLAARGAVTPGFLRLARRRRMARTLPPLPTDTVVDHDFAARVGLRESLRTTYLAHPDKRLSFAEKRHHAFLHTNITVARERYDRAAALAGVEPRDPFLDRRVIEFCLSLPMDQLQADGWPKIVLRRAMAGRLPDGVRWRKGKEHLGYLTTRALLEHAKVWRETIEENRMALEDRVVPWALDPDATDWFEYVQTAGETALATAVFFGNVRRNTQDQLGGGTPLDLW